MLCGKQDDFKFLLGGNNYETCVFLLHCCVVIAAPHLSLYMLYSFLLIFSVTCVVTASLLITFPNICMFSMFKSTRLRSYRCLHYL